MILCQSKMFIHGEYMTTSNYICQKKKIVLFFWKKKKTRNLFFHHIYKKKISMLNPVWAIYFYCTELHTNIVFLYNNFFIFIQYFFKYKICFKINPWLMNFFVFSTPNAKWTEFLYDWSAVPCLGHIPC